jgi:hypothetical protein
MSKQNGFLPRIALAFVTCAISGAGIDAMPMNITSHTFQIATVLSILGATPTPDGTLPAEVLDSNQQRTCMYQCQQQGAQCNSACNSGDLMCTNRCIQQQSQCYGSCKQ